MVSNFSLSQVCNRFIHNTILRYNIDFLFTQCLIIKVHPDEDPIKNKSPYQFKTPFYYPLTIKTGQRSPLSNYPRLDAQPIFLETSSKMLQPMKRKRNLNIQVKYTIDARARTYTAVRPRAILPHAIRTVVQTHALYT